MSDNPLPPLFSTFTSEAFRLETLPRYLVPEEAEELQRYLDGEPLPLHTRHQEWLVALDDWRDQGKTIVRVRLLPRQITQYQEFELAWGYPYNAQHGEKIYIITADLYQLHFGAEAHDWWLFDNQTAADMKYGEKGEFLGAERAATDEPYRDMRSKLLEYAVPLNEYFRLRRSEAG